MGERTLEEERIAELGVACLEGMNTPFWETMVEDIEQRIEASERRLLTGLPHDEYLDECRTVGALNRVLRIPQHHVDNYHQLLRKEGRRA